MIVSAALMVRRFLRVLRYAFREEDFGPIFGAGVLLVALGTITYTVGGNWSVVDGFYFAVGTLTTSSIADPKLTITDPWLKIFTASYILVGIGILVEMARRLGLSFIAIHRHEREAKGPEGAVFPAAPS
jgi:hypothetical protein